MPPPIGPQKSPWESTPTIIQPGDTERGLVEMGSNSHVTEANEKNQNDGARPLTSLNSKNGTNGDVRAELDSELIVWWDGLEDPDNPMNWSPTCKWINICIISVISFLV